MYMNYEYTQKNASRTAPSCYFCKFHLVALIKPTHSVFILTSWCPSSICTRPKLTHIGAACISISVVHTHLHLLHFLPLQSERVHNLILALSGCSERTGCQCSSLESPNRRSRSRILCFCHSVTEKKTLSRRSST